jgi:hypothetical protein
MLAAAAVVVIVVALVEQAGVETGLHICHQRELQVPLIPVAAVAADLTIIDIRVVQVSLSFRMLQTVVMESRQIQQVAM